MKTVTKVLWHNFSGLLGYKRSTLNIMKIKFNANLMLLKPYLCQFNTASTIEIHTLVSSEADLCHIQCISIQNTSLYYFFDAFVTFCCGPYNCWCASLTPLVFLLYSTTQGYILNKGIRNFTKVGPFCAYVCSHN